MLYQEIETTLRSEFGTSELEKWIADCGQDSVTKIISFNLFCDIHFEPIPPEELLDCVRNLESALRSSPQSSDPLDRMVDKIPASFPHLWHSHPSDMSDVTRLYRLMDVSLLDKMMGSMLKKPMTKGSFAYTKEDAQKLVQSFQVALGSGSMFFLGNMRGVVWFSPHEDVELLVGKKAEAEDRLATVQSLLGIPYQKGQMIVEMKFDDEPAWIGRRPTVFHAGLDNPYWKPSGPENSWGMTLDLKSQLDGARESVRQGGVWPQNCDLEVLGASKGPDLAPDWEETYLQSRIDAFVDWAGGKIEILNDLDYFRGKW